MRIVVIAGGGEDERHLGRLAAAGIELEFQHVHADELDEEQSPSNAGSPPAGAHAALEPDGPRALVFEALDRLDVAVSVLRAVRADPYFHDVVALVAVAPGHVADFDGESGFDDFLLHPYRGEELLARIVSSELRRDGSRGQLNLEGIVVDRAGREVHVDGRAVPLTAKEFALLSYLCERQGRVLSREQLLARVWGNRYGGGSRTVDIHVRRLRAKLGAALPLETLRGSGYKLRRPPLATSLPSALAEGRSER